MKNILKINALAIAVFFLAGPAAKAQDIKNDAAMTAGQLEAPPQDGTKKDGTATTTTTTTTKTDAQADKKDSKQEPVKTTKSDSKADKKDSTGDGGGGTRMAITEQGMPKSNKNKPKKSAAKTSNTPAESKDQPKK